MTKYLMYALSILVTLGTWTLIDASQEFMTEYQLEKAKHYTKEQWKHFRNSTETVFKQNNKYNDEIKGALDSKNITEIIRLMKIAGFVKEINECYESEDRGKKSYTGTQTVTQGGYTCQHWNQQTPHQHHTAKWFPDGVNPDHNYCRNPDVSREPWCFTTDPNVKWQFCHVPECIDSVKNREMLQRVGLYLAAHKYFEIERREVDERSYKFAERNFHKRFPDPPLERFHKSVETECTHGIHHCVGYLYKIANNSKAFIEEGKQPSVVKDDIKLFSSALERFKFRTTATYYMCWFTMMRYDYLKQFSPGKCLLGLDTLREQHLTKINVTDVREQNTTLNPFLCAEIFFCPDPCYGRTSGGTVLNETIKYDPGNPCKDLAESDCGWDHKKNTNFHSLIRNVFNVTCNCNYLINSTQPEFATDFDLGYEWNSQYGFCIDIDECAREAYLCTNGKTCQNYEGSFACTCTWGQHYNFKLKSCEEYVPLPRYSLSQHARVKPKVQQTLLMRHIWYLFGLKPLDES